MKYAGKIGFVETSELKDGVSKDIIIEKPYRGDVLQSSRYWSDASGNYQLNDDLMINNRISIVGDPYAMRNIYKMKYLEWNGTKWKITNVDVQYPRLILTISDVWLEES